LLSGGLQGLQTASIVAALPFAVILVLMVFVLLRALREDHPRKARTDVPPGSDPALGFGQRTVAAQSEAGGLSEGSR
jgi:choline-glycine betaine transporter